MAAPPYTLRPATDDDREFLWCLVVATMKDYVDQTWGWDEDDQRRLFDEKVDIPNARIVVIDGADAGLFVLYHPAAPDPHPAQAEDFAAGAYYVAEIELMPPYQRRGIGAAILRDVIAEARSGGRPVALRVLKVNPARRLYERLGFALIGESDTHYLMRTPS